MPKTKTSEWMDSITDEIAVYLKPLGFKKQRHTFNRWTSDGLCQVFNLQMGPYEFGHMNPFYGSLYGKFTANLGIFVPEVCPEKFGQEAPKFINEGICTIRVRFSNLLNSRRDLWWNLNPAPGPITSKLIKLTKSSGLPFFEPVPSKLIKLIETRGLPFYEQFSSRELIIKNLIQFAEKHDLTRPKLDLALILDHLGRAEEAQTMFMRHYNEQKDPGHIQYLQAMAKRHNWNIS